MDTKTIIKHCKRGNQIAQRTLYDAYYNYLFNLAMRLVKNYHDAEDILINAYSRIFKYIGNFEYQGDASMIKWMKTIVVNESVRFLNSKIHLHFEDTSSSEVYDMKVAENHFSSVDTEKIYEIIEKLPDGYRYNLSKTINQPNWLGIEIGYLTHNTSRFFGQNTFRLGMNWELGKYISVMPSLYFSDNFDTLYPGIRIGVGF